ncbi:MAG: STM4015 family protein [Gemmataceae bacterium]|nr:STM4015 family protein [Gemmataceae bacterium]
MSIFEHLTTFAGLPVETFDPKAKKKSRRRCVYRVGGLDHVKTVYRGGDHTFPELLDLFLTQHGGKELTALVVGAWDYDDMCESLSDMGAAEVVEALVANRRRMPNLRALFLGDVTQDECEISWIAPRDISPLFAAFPKLEEFRVRGAAALTFGKLKHNNLRVFAIESGGLPEAVLQEVWEAKLPKLEHLELWLGSPSYGGISSPEPLEPLLEGKLFRKLKYLGLRNSEIANSVAEAVAGADLLERLEVLDLSLGNMTEAGAEPLLESLLVRKLKKLDLHHHFISPAFVRELKKLPLEVDVSDAKEPDFDQSGDRMYVFRYIAADE